MNDIFTHFIAREDAAEANKRLAYAQWFVDSIPLSEFTGDERIFCEFIDYCAKLNVPITFPYFQIWISTELRELLHACNIKVKGCETLNYDDPMSFETAFQITTNVMLDNFQLLEGMDSNINDFKVNIASYFSTRRNERLTQSLAETYDLLNSSNSSEDAADFALDSIHAVRDIYDDLKLEELDNSNSGVKAQMIKVSDCGLPAIDKDSGGLFTTQLLGVEAQPGTGKTRFTLGTYVYRALTVYHKNVLFLALEQTEQEIDAMLIACHVFYMFNIQMTDKMILTGNIPEEIRPQYEAAKYDLFESGKYGKFVAKEVDLYVETFITKLRTYDKLLGPFDLIAIDYMGLLESKPAQYRKELTEYEIIKTGFKQFKRYLRRSGKAGIAVSQFNRDGIQAGKADKEITTEMAQGGIAVYRNTDYNIAMSMTETMRLQQKRRLSQPKVRSSAGFPSFIVDTRLGFLYFKQVVTKEV